MDYQEIINTCYCGDGKEKLAKAESLAEEYGHSLSQQRDVLDQLAVVQTAVEVLDAHMAAMEMGKTCSQCAARPDGGCCSAYMGNENNDALQLLMNILAGVEVKLIRDDGVECCFLGERGCVLLFKPIFCLNYLCGRIQEGSDKEELRQLEQKTGALLTAQSTLEQIIIRFLQQSSV
ncbi:MAG: hypothetical protein U9R57_03055 [Thermodesulfobacteriota bacterium]|nr:hypothetical protein [Thermodesulfobacteriota bacterium]